MFFLGYVRKKHWKQDVVIMFSNMLVFICNLLDTKNNYFEHLLSVQFVGLWGIFRVTIITRIPFPINPIAKLLIPINQTYRKQCAIKKSCCYSNIPNKNLWRNLRNKIKRNRPKISLMHSDSKIMWYAFFLIENKCGISQQQYAKYAVVVRRFRSNVIIVLIARF